MSNRKYKPDTVSPPGHSLQDLLEERNISLTKFSKISGIHYDNLKKIVVGEKSLNFKFAWKLERATNIPIEFWLARERRYREYLDGK